MKTKYQFETMDLDDVLVAVPVGEGAEAFKGVLKVNETAAAILKLLAQDTTEEAIVSELLKEYAGDKAEIAAYVHEYIEKLAAEGLVE
ncbi:MAG: PqqD family protein [Clostridia bacterium]|nr:PqqD family protein [Clostridia bacterium]